MLPANRFFTGLLIFTFFAFLPLTGQTQNFNVQALKVQQLYDSLQFEKVISLSRQLLKQPEQFQPDDLILIHQYSGYAFFNFGQPDSAKKHFLAILNIDPEYEFDPVRTSPKIISFFKKIKETYRQELSQKKLIAFPRYVFLKDPRPEAAWRSLALPGWGQMFKKQKKKAYLFGGAFVTGVAATLVAYQLESSYHEKYLQSTEPSAIKDNYDRYNLWYKTRKISTIATAGIWLWAFADALWTPFEKVALLPKSSDGLQLSLKFRF